MGFPNEGDVVCAGSRGDVREFRGSGERILADRVRAYPDHPDRLA
ncbi:hypothetical protein ACIQXA_35770 [Streptomyces massasporeus]